MEVTVKHFIDFLKENECYEEFNQYIDDEFGESLSKYFSNTYIDNLISSGFLWDKNDNLDWSCINEMWVAKYKEIENKKAKEVNMAKCKERGNEVDKKLEAKTDIEKALKVLSEITVRWDDLYGITINPNKHYFDNDYLSALNIISDVLRKKK